MKIGKLHSKCGQGAVYVNRKRHYLGKWDGKGEPPVAVIEALRMLKLRLQAGYRGEIEAMPTTVSELICEHLDRLKLGKIEIYNRDRSLLKVWNQFHGPLPLKGYGPRLLAEFQQHLVTLGRSRSGINAMLVRLRFIFRWAVSREFITADHLVAMESVRGLRVGQTTARETSAIPPVDPELFDKTVALLPEKYRQVAMLCRYTGMRPGEACNLVWEDIDTTSKPWVAKLTRHKNAARGKTRQIPLPPKAMAILSWMGGERTGRVFDRCVNTMNFASAIRLACKHGKLPGWTPNQIRKLVASEIRQKFTLEHARSLLGHTDSRMTQEYYATADLKRASEAAQGL